MSNADVCIPSCLEFVAKHTILLEGDGSTSCLRKKGPAVQSSGSELTYQKVREIGSLQFDRSRQRSQQIFQSMQLSMKLRPPARANCREDGQGRIRRKHAGERGLAGNLTSALKKLLPKKHHLVHGPMESSQKHTISKYHWIPLDLPAHNTIDAAQCLASSAVEHEHGLCPKDAIHQGLRTATSNACSLCSPARRRQQPPGERLQTPRHGQELHGVTQ